MTMNKAPQRLTDDGSNANIAETGGHGGRLATILSALALCFSGLSFYESAWKTANLEVFVPPVVYLARDGETEVFAVPVTIANDGARTATVLSLELEAENLKSGAEPKTKRYYSAFLGEHPHLPEGPNRSFAPLSILGKSTFTETVRFYTTGDVLPRLIEDKGDYRFTLKLDTAGAAAPQPLVFERILPWYSDQQLSFRRAVIGMNDKDWKANQ